VEENARTFNWHFTHRCGRDVVLDGSANEVTRSCTSDDQNNKQSDDGSASHASEGSLMGCKVLLMRTVRQALRQNRKSTEAHRQAMAGISRQAIGIDTNTIFLLFWFLVSVGILYWLYSTLKRIEKTLLEIKRILENKNP
jgi:hypothetical protein